MKDVNLKQVEELNQWLQNERTPDGIRIGEGNQPDLSGQQAFTVIWFLQEHLGVLPENYEKCQKCGDLYDTWTEGFTGEYVVPENTEDAKHGFWCSSYCMPDNVEII